MIRIREWRERLFAWQDVTRNRWILSFAFILCGVALLGPLCWSSYNYSKLRWRIASVLSEANIAEKNPIAVQLIERGSVTIDGVEIGSERIRTVADQMFDRNGVIAEADYVSSFIASSVSPGWAPVTIIERPWIVAGISLGFIAFILLAVWVGMGIQFMIVLLLSGGLMALFWVLSNLQLMVAVAGIGLLIFAFILLIRIALISLSSPRQIMAVAHTLLIEALRLRISIGFIGALLIILPLIPLWIDQREPLRYQIQTFISRGTGLVFVIAACLTLFLSCATVSFEIRDRQIWNVLTKPISRFQYMSGKILGLSVLNGIVLIVGGVAVFCYVQLLSTRAPADLQDASAVQNQVLVARATERPAYKLMDVEKLRDIVNSTIENDSLLKQAILDGIKSEVDVAREIRSTKTTEFMAAQRTIEPGKSRSFEFTGLQNARQSASQPTLRYVFHISQDSSHDLFPVLISFGDSPAFQVNYVPVQRNVVVIPIEAIREDGTLRVTLLNGGITSDGQIYPSPWSMNFDADGLEVLHRVGGFEANYFRAMLIDWVKLIFIASLGVAAASVLSFPVAVLLSVTIFIAASISPFLALALENYAISPDSNILIQISQFFIEKVVGAVQWSLAPFAAAGSSTDLIDGRAITWTKVMSCIGQIGILWSFAVFMLGFLAFRKKEIAIYSGGDS